MHHNCEFSGCTEHGYKIVEVIEKYCEIGQGCYEKCPFSWKADDEATSRKADEAYERAFPEPIVELSPAEHDAWPRLK